MEDLIDVLNKEEEQYQGLIELGKKKREVVVRLPTLHMDATLSVLQRQH